MEFTGKNKDKPLQSKSALISKKPCFHNAIKLIVSRPQVQSISNRSKGSGERWQFTTESIWSSFQHSSVHLFGENDLSSCLQFQACWFIYIYHGCFPRKLKCLPTRLYAKERAIQLTFIGSCCPSLKLQQQGTPLFIDWPIRYHCCDQSGCLLGCSI